MVDFAMLLGLSPLTRNSGAPLILRSLPIPFPYFKGFWTAGNGSIIFYGGLSKREVNWSIPLMLDDLRSKRMNPISHRIRI